MNGIMLIGIPESTGEIIKLISEKTGLSMVDVISEALKDYALRALEPKVEEEAQSKPSIRFSR